MAARTMLSTLTAALSLTGSLALTSTPYAYTDDKGIKFSQVTESGGLSFGMSLPQEGSDWIGRIEAPITEGWVGLSMGSSMTAYLLVVAWPNGDNVVSSLRKATDYATPGLYTGAASLKTISSSVNSTAFTYTFVCQNCTDIGAISFESTTETWPIGWAMSKTAVTTPGSPSSAVSSHVGTGQDIQVMKLSEARTDDFATYAAMASNSTTTPATGSGGSTNGTQPVYNGTVGTANATYDYIVVGGGGAGIIAAQRLVETGKTVLLVERGKASFYNSGGNLTVPWNNTVTIYDAPYMYNYLSSYPGNDALCSDTPAMAGCILGGGTAVNGLAFIKPPAHDFDDNWPTGWKWSDVKASAERFYKRNPGTTSPSADGKQYDFAVYDVLSKNLASAGWTKADTNAEPDSKEKIYSPPAINVLNGRRAGPVATYLPLMQGKSNFKLLLETMVLRAVRTNSTITGIETQSNSGVRTIYNVNPGGKVILAAGAMSSPRILFRSGIGPKKQIQTVKTGSVAVTLPEESSWIESPVGYVKDHTNIVVSFNVTNGMKVMGKDDYLTPSQANIDLFNKASGPLTESTIMRLNTFRTVTTSDNKKLIVQTHNYATKNDTIDVIFILTHGTTSSGTLGITAEGNTVWETSPYLQTDTDKEAMTMVIDEWLEMSRLANSTIKYNGAANITGAQIVATVATSAGTHMIGTTKMGIDKNSSVVDTDCKVYGTDNLFVVDAGMHADIPTGNTQAIVGVAAERAAERIIALSGGSIPGAAASANSSSSVVLSGTATPSVSSASKPVTPATSAPAVSASASASASASIPASQKPSASAPASSSVPTTLATATAPATQTSTGAGGVPVYWATPSSGAPYWATPSGGAWGSPAQSEVPEWQTKRW
ncbi:FAD/NAD(P)-binding domain-containing protein [Massarina eburnea CBS 473.64]|uniref:FAD/NAD(P)-binding domain-containing protein n=1 Tax=Massarina eburnea CBS 473.64 TaxID=1395130 RepID=A0A6A6S4H4_9PLEO|nr:FAD/NAD(P)-binding domain-containing protein [Massarina eburnea CBS 473.64]